MASSILLLGMLFLVELGRSDVPSTATAGDLTDGSVDGLQDRECGLKVIGDGPFFFKVGKARPHFSKRYMRYLVARSDGIFRRMDLNVDGRDDRIGFVSAAPAVVDLTSELLHDAPLRPDDDGRAFLQRLRPLADPRFCFVLLFTSRLFADNAIGGAFSGGAEDDREYGGVCRWPNVGFVNLERYDQELSHDQSVVATARVLATAFGARPDGPECSDRRSVLADPFPEHIGVDDMALSTCTRRDIRRSLSRTSSCLGPTHSEHNDGACTADWISIFEWVLCAFLARVLPRLAVGPLGLS